MELRFGRAAKIKAHSFSMTDEDLGELRTLGEFYDQKLSPVVRALILEHAATLKKEDRKGWNAAKRKLAQRLKEEQEAKEAKASA